MLRAIYFIARWYVWYWMFLDWTSVDWLSKAGKDTVKRQLIFNFRTVCIQYSIVNFCTVAYVFSIANCRQYLSHFPIISYQLIFIFSSSGKDGSDASSKSSRSPSPEDGTRKGDYQIFKCFWSYYCPTSRSVLSLMTFTLINRNISNSF